MQACGVHWGNGLQQVALLGVTCSRCGLQHCVKLEVRQQTSGKPYVCLLL